MRKFYFLFSGALLLSMTAVSQVTFERHADDPRVIFHQDFEATPGLSDKEAYIEWSTTPIDTILELEYYAKKGSSTPRTVDIYAPENAADWSIFAVRTDSVSSEHPETSYGKGIVIFNGVEVSSSASEKANHVYDKDSYTIVNDGGQDVERNEAFAMYGESGGQSYFKYETGGIDATKIQSSHYSTDTRSTKNYRRDLYVRGLDIEDESSYRLTFYIKTKKRNSWGPLFYADLMRGYHHQRAPFSMGYKSGKDFSFSMNEFEDGQWQKVTIMNYYINAHEADAYVIYKGDYSWTDDWSWRPSDEELAAIGKSLEPGEMLNFVKQPDKFFIRFSFATDSIEYSLDNLTLTKSWIGGCEYHNDIMRINLGYETNLKDIVEAEMKRTNIPAVELPNEDMKYITVWYLDQDGDPDKASDWKRMPIRSAEYHADGYMYLFTESYPNPSNPSQPITLKFGDKKQVLVSFNNPIDKPELTLKYTGDLYPKPLDTEWVNNGKIVPNFYNEIAVPNPNITKGVTSIDGLPPIMKKAPFEEGSFGLPLNTNQLSFQFTKEVKVDQVFNGQNTQNTMGVIAYFDDEVWEPTWDAATSSLVITRPAGFTSSLQGDHTIHIVHVKGTGGDEGNDVLMHYHFGTFSKNIESTNISSDWRSEGNGVLTGFNPASTYIHDGNSTFRKGGGSKGKTRVYAMSGDYPDDCGYVLTVYSETEGETANMYSIVHFDKAEDLSIKFKVTGWSYSGTKLPNVAGYLYFYPAPEGNLEDGNDKGFAVLQGCTKTELGSFTPKTYVKKSVIEDKDTGVWPDEVETKEYNFTVPAAGDYVFEWVTKDGNKDGIFISNYNISSVSGGNLSTPYVSKLNKAVETAQEKLTEATPAQYRGEDYNALATAIEEGDAYMGNFPSKYDSVVAHINNIVTTMTLRIDTVDLFYAEEEKVDKLLASFTGDSVQYKELATYKALNTHKTANVNWDCTNKTTRAIALETEAYQAEEKALETRLSIIVKFNDKIKEVGDFIDAANARKDYEEYDAMKAARNTALNQDLINPTDSVIIAETAKLNDAKNDYWFKFDYEIAKTRQIKELYNLADSLGYDFGGKKDSIRGIVFTLVDDETALSNVLREAVILQILKIYRDKNEEQLEKMEGYDVSALIPNYFLYNEAKADIDMDISSAGTWRIKKDKDNTTAFPGWTVRNSGTTYPGQTEMDWKVDGHVFIGGIHFSSNTTGKIGATVVGLPQGYYNVSLDMLQNNVTNNKMNLTTTTDTILFTGTKTASRKVHEIGDSVRIVDGSPLTFGYEITGASSSGHVAIDHAVLKLTARDDKADYNALVTAQEKKLNGLITFVGAPVMKESVEYYNLGGMKINNPKSGEIIIRKTTRNGKVVVDKVLVK